MSEPVRRVVPSEMIDFRSVSITRSYQQVVEQILERIQLGEFVPGKKLPTERDLGEMFAVSRGVIREALKVLITLGVVESIQGSGTYVSANLVPSLSRALVLSARPEEESLVALLEFREPLERQAAGLAAMRRTDEEALVIQEAAQETVEAGRTNDWERFARADNRLHIAISEASRNSFLYTVLSAVKEIQHSVVTLVVVHVGEIHIAGEQHSRIADAITASDAELASALMAEHVSYSTGAVHRALAMPKEERLHLDFQSWRKLASPRSQSREGVGWNNH